MCCIFVLVYDRALFVLVLIFHEVLLAGFRTGKQFALIPLFKWVYWMIKLSLLFVFVIICLSRVLCWPNTFLAFVPFHASASFTLLFTMLRATAFPRGLDYVHSIVFDDLILLNVFIATFRLKIQIYLS